MFVIRLTYYSRNQIDHSAGSAIRELGAILEASSKNNNAAGLTGALVFDERWFLQTLEGRRTAVWNTFKRIEADERHSNVMVVDARNIRERIFENWWLALVKPDGSDREILATFLRNGHLKPDEMTSEQILELMAHLSKIGSSRRLAPSFSDRFRARESILSYE
ncbi:MAG: BLUF domain-containing protein [Beijerinckiaceae bacterium]|nr:BLUF domain-containing protein [Beijerinckiaceae bacterium]